MRQQVTMLIITLGISHGSMAVAQTIDRTACNAPANPNVMIANCTAFIQSEHGTTDDLSTAYNNRGDAYYQNGNSDRAIQDFDQAIRLNPNYAEAFGNRGSAYYQKGNYDRAIQDFDQAIRLDPNDAEMYNNRATAYYQKGITDRAIQDFSQAISLDPNFAYALFNRGELYLTKQDCARAMQDLDKAKQLNRKFSIPPDTVASCVSTPEP